MEQSSVPIPNFKNIRPAGVDRTDRDRRTDMTRLTGAFSDHANAPKKSLPLPDINPLKPELNPICYLLALLGAHHFLHVSRIGVKLLTLR